MGARDKDRFAARKRQACGFDCEGLQWDDEKEQEQPPTLEGEQAADEGTEAAVAPKGASKGKLQKVFPLPRRPTNESSRSPLPTNAKEKDAKGPVATGWDGTPLLSKLQAKG